MDFFKEILDYFLHLDDKLAGIMQEYQKTTYLILCIVIFCETGLVATPLLPGDSLLFAAGMLTAQNGILNVWILIPLLFASAILGDNTNYFIGKYFGTRLFDMRGLKRILKKEYLKKTEDFYAKHGGKTIIMARFVPIVRTFAPFVAGIGAMNYSRYIAFCVVGGALWVCSLTLAGYYLASIPFVKEHFEKVVFGIILVSVMPILFTWLRSKFAKK